MVISNSYCKGFYGQSKEEGGKWAALSGASIEGEEFGVTSRDFDSGLGEVIKCINV